MVAVCVKWFEEFEKHILWKIYTIIVIEKAFAGKQI